MTNNMEIIKSSNENLESELSYIKEKCSYIFSRPFNHSEEIIDFVEKKNVHICSLEEELKKTDSLLTCYINSEKDLIRENDSLKETIFNLNRTLSELLVTKTDYEKLEEIIRHTYVYLYHGLEVPNSLFEIVSIFKKKIIDLCDVEETLKEEQNKNILYEHLKLECKFLVDSLAEEKSQTNNLKSVLDQKEMLKSSLEEEFKIISNKCELLHSEITELKGGQAKIEQELSSCKREKFKLSEIMQQIKILFECSDPQQTTADDVLIKIKSTMDDLEFTKTLLNKEKEKSCQLDLECNALDLRKQYLESRLCDVFKENNLQITSVLEEKKKMKQINKQLEIEKISLEKTIEELQSKVTVLEKNLKSTLLRKNEELLWPLSKPTGECKDCCLLIDNLKELKLDLVDRTSKVTRLEITVETLRSQSERRLNTIDNYKTKIHELKNELKKAESALIKKVRDAETNVDFLKRDKVDASSQTERNEDPASVKACPSNPPPNFVQMCKINELLAKVESQNKKYATLKKAYQLKDEELKYLRGKADCKLMSPKKPNRVVFEDKTNV